ncbi:MAG: hypothetical protein Q9216_001310 [Gyalolechia sp. 2 TL-2023]
MDSPNYTAPQPISSSRLQRAHSRHSYYGASPLAEASIARDLEDDSDVEPHRGSGGTDVLVDGYDSDNSLLQVRGDGKADSMVVAPGLQSTRRDPTRSEREEARRQERSLLRDNNCIPPKHAQNSQPSRSLVRRLSRQFANLGIPRPDKRLTQESEESTAASSEPTSLPETAPLLGNPELPYGGQDSPEMLDKQWNQALAAGKIHTTWQREAKVLSRYSAPLIVTFLLQYSLTVASIFTVGHLGKVPLGAVSLASMTANITGYAVYQGLATSLDTLCAQAYGSGKKKLVGLQTQRMVYFLWTITIPIGIIWLSAESILTRIVPEHEVAILAGRYLKIILIGAPGYACFESAKRYLQAQGLFSASLYVLLICAPLNAFMNWCFVWYFGWGFIGAPIAVAVTDNLLPIFLILYVVLVSGKECWPGLSRRAWKNWGPMVKLALPGFMMVEAECLAFEVLTLASSYFGTTHLAAQSVLATISSLTFQIPFPISIAASTRVANLIGAGLADAAKKSAQMGIVASAGVGILNVVLLSSLRDYIPRLFTNDVEVIELVAKVLPLCAAFQLFDALSCCCNGILRGLGRQEVGGWVQLFCYYGVAVPVSLGLGFGAEWELYGLWTGIAVGLGLVAGIEGAFLWRARWERSVEDAERRNLMA